MQTLRLGTCVVAFVLGASTARAGSFGAWWSAPSARDERPLERLMRSARELARAAQVSDENWLGRKNLQDRLLDDIVNAQSLLGFRTLSRFDHADTSPGAALIIHALETSLTRSEINTLYLISPRLFRIWEAGDVKLRRGLAYVYGPSESSGLDRYFGFRARNFLKNCELSLKRVEKYAFFTILGWRGAPDWTIPFRDLENWRRALAVVSFQAALKMSLEPAR